MALQFFRKHKKYFNILMIAAVFAMVTFGGLWYADDAMKVFKNWMAGENPNDPTVLVAYGQRITGRERYRVEQNCQYGARLEEFVRQLGQFGSQKDIQALGKTFRNSIMLMRYAAASQSGTPEDVRKITDATAVLMLEARRAGIVVGDDMIKNTVLSEWAAAGVTEDSLKGLAQQFFGGSMEMLYSVLRQELTLSLYLESISQSARVVEEDVWSAYRTINQKTKVQTVDIKYETYLPKISQPTDAEVQAQFAKYKGVLQDDPAAPFGYKIPDRVELQYLTIDFKAIEADQKVTDEEIQKYYDDNKDRLYVKKEEPAKKGPAETPEAPKTGPTPADAEPTPDAGKTDAPKTDAPKTEAPKTEAPKVETPKADTPAPDANAQPPKPPKTLNAPEDAATATTTDQPAEPAKAPVAETPKTDAPKVDAPKADETPKAETPKTPETPKAETPKAEEKPKEYQPLEQVREKIKTTLVQQKAADEAQRLADEAVTTLQSSPLLGLAHVAKGKYMKVYGSKGLRTAKEISDLPGIGKANAYGRGKNAGTSIPFSELAFSLEGFVGKPVVALKVVSDQVLSDDVGNRYLFVVADKKAAEEPASLEQVKKDVVHDLQKVAAYREAEKTAEVVLNHAFNTNLSIEAMQVLGTKANDPRDLRRTDIQYGDESEKALVKAVFEVVDAGGRFGTLGSPTYEKVTVFEVLEVTLATEATYALMRDSFVNMALGNSRIDLLGSFTDPDVIIRRSGLVEKELARNSPQG